MVLYNYHLFVRYKQIFGLFLENGLSIPLSFKTDIMNKSQAIFQEIENKLVKDDYASTLPAYHPAKGRRKKVLKDLERPADNFSQIKSGEGIGIVDSEILRSQEPFPTPDKKDLPDPSPEIEDPNEEEFDPSRDFPRRDIDSPNEEEIPEREQNPEIEDPDEEEFYR